MILLLVGLDRILVLSVVKAWPGMIPLFFQLVHTHSESVLSAVRHVACFDGLDRLRVFQRCLGHTCVRKMRHLA